MITWDSSDSAKNLFEKMNETAYHINENIKPYPKDVFPRKYGFSYNNTILKKDTENLLKDLKD